jgi:hypothetical protein
MHDDVEAGEKIVGAVPLGVLLRYAVLKTHRESVT